MSNIVLKTIFITPVALIGVLAGAGQVHADTTSNVGYSIDPRFVGNPDIGKTQTKTITFRFNHGNRASDPLSYRVTPKDGGESYLVGGFWSGALSATVKYRFTSMNSIEVLKNGVDVNVSDNNASSSGAGFYDAIMIAPAGYNSWDEPYVRQPEKRTSELYTGSASLVDGYDHANKLLNYAKTNGSQGLIFAAFHYNRSTSFNKNEYYYETKPGVTKSYVVYGNKDHTFIPLTAVNRWLNPDRVNEARWAADPLGNLTISQPKIKEINNTTGVDSYARFVKDKSVVAPSGEYTINDNHDSDKKMLSWPTGGSNNKYYGVGNKMILRNMSPIIQANRMDNSQDSNAGLTQFIKNQTFKQSVWVPNDFEYKTGDAKIYAITTPGKKIDVTNRFNFAWGEQNNSTKSRRLIATIKNLNDATIGGYNNTKTVGYSMITPVKVSKSARTGAYNVRGGSQIINGTWHDTGTDKVYVYASTPPTPPTSGAQNTSWEHATVFNNDSATDFSENKSFYNWSSYGSNKTFRSGESDGIYVWHTYKPLPKVPADVLAKKADDADITPWQTTQPIVFTIPYDNKSQSPIGVQVARDVTLSSGWVSRTIMLGNTNGITVQDTGNSYVVTLPPTLLNPYLTNNVQFGVLLKYKVKSEIPGRGTTINTVSTVNDELMGLSKTNNVTNYLVTPRNSYVLNTLKSTSDDDTQQSPSDDKTDYEKLNVRRSYWVQNNYSVHFNNDQKYTYDTQYFNIGANSSDGVGEPLKKLTMKTTVKPNQIPKSVLVYKGNTLVSVGKFDTSSNYSKITFSGTSNKSDLASGFDGSITNANDRTKDSEINVNAKADLLKSNSSLYNTGDDFNIQVLTSTDSLSGNDKYSNLTDIYWGGGNNIEADMTASNGLTADSSARLIQGNSRKKPESMLTKHDAWPGINGETDASVNFAGSSVQAREKVDYRVLQFFGNNDLNTEAYATPLTLHATLPSEVKGNLSEIKVMQYNNAGSKLYDASSDFDISYDDATHTYSAKLKDKVVKSATGDFGVNYNRLYVFNVPVTNQEDKLTLEKNTFTGAATIAGQKVDSTLVSEFIPPETPQMYGYSATSSDNWFTKDDPEKDRGKISDTSSDGSSTSAQISTAPSQWVISEQLGDTSTKLDQKYSYSKFGVTFPNVSLLQSVVDIDTKDAKWRVYRDDKIEVSNKFTGKQTSAGYKISAKQSFLDDKSNYSHKYYFVKDDTTENNHRNRRALSNLIYNNSNYQSFRDIGSYMYQFNGSVDIGNTTKTVRHPNFSLPTDTDMLQINSTVSGLNEKTAELNTRRNHGDFENTDAAIKTVVLDRPIAGYDVTGSTAQFATNARGYESYRTTFVANNSYGAQQIRSNSLKIVDSQTGADVTSQYNVGINDGEDVRNAKVTLELKQEALDRLQKYHKTDAGRTAQDTVSFHVDTWGSRYQDTAVTWISTQNINGYDDAKAIEKVLIPKAHAGKTSIAVSPAGKNDWTTSDYHLKKIDEAVDLKVAVTVPTDLHNVDFTDFMTHYITSEITPFMNNSSVTAKMVVGNNSDYNNGSDLSLITDNPSGQSLTGSRQVWKLPDSVVNSIMTSRDYNNSPTYTIIFHNVQYTPTGTENDTVRSISQYKTFLSSDNYIKIPVGSVTSSQNGNRDDLQNNYFEGRNGKIVDSSIGSLGSGSSLGLNSGKINIILPKSQSYQDGYINGRQSNNSYINNND